jgi:predicted phage terminase large subunit-like protein|tara:strand:- start:600 stop:2075 length:1476 start_codon:yes stop_codon:yes gene_type:complete
MRLTLDKINKIPDVQVREKLKADIIAGYENQKAEEARKDFLTFVKKMWPQFIEGSHHKIISDKFNRVASGELTRLIINMPPRHTKSEFASYFLPAWMIGNYPQLKIIQATHTAELAVNFGRKTKNLIDSKEYQDLFATRLQEDSKAAGRWNTAQGGEYFAVGVQGAVTGRGADLLIIDDPHSEQDVNSPNAFEKTYEWYTSGPRQRLQPGGRIILVMTRWSKKDLTEMLLAAQAEDKADKWEVVEFPAIMPSGKPVWPEYWKLEDLESVKASAGVNKWNAQYMQNPTSDEGALIKREWWQDWEGEMPILEHVIQSYDTAFLKKQTADYSAITTWGVFRKDEDSPQSIILIDAIKGRYEFPELKRLAYDQYMYWKPETVLVEAKAAGLPLIFELRKMGIPVADFTPNRGNDKHARVNSVAPLFESGRIYAPKNQEFAQEVIEECAAFPYGDHDDLVDSTTQAIMRFRDGGLITHPDDYKDKPRAKKRYKYYW